MELEAGGKTDENNFHFPQQHNPQFQRAYTRSALMHMGEGMCVCLHISRLRAGWVKRHHLFL